MDISGFCFIYTEEEYQENKDILDEQSAGGVDVVILKNFVGTINVDVRFTKFDMKTRISTIESESLLKPDADIKEYLKYETDVDNDDTRYDDFQFDTILFIDGTYTKYEKHTVEEFLEL
jgi:hypothetical protein